MSSRSKVISDAFAGTATAGGRGALPWKPTYGLTKFAHAPMEHDTWMHSKLTGITEDREQALASKLEALTRIVNAADNGLPIATANQTGGQ